MRGRGCGRKGYERLPLSTYARVLVACLSLTTFACQSKPTGLLDGGICAFQVPRPIELTAGSNHTCALLTCGGGVQCWGDNGFGQLGTGTTHVEYEPVRVIGLPADIQMLSAGGNHTCALSDGHVLCWGDNEFGELGNGSFENTSTPVAVIGIGAEVETVTAGVNHTCATTVDGGALCWGDNAYGELGNGSDGGSATPVRVSGISDIDQLVAGDAMSCAITSAGSVFCWGRNDSGQLGNNSTLGSSTPVQVAGLPWPAEFVTLGQAHVCALLGLTMYCWGNNEYGQLGDGSTLDRLTPVLPLRIVPYSTTVITAGGNHTCAAEEGGSCLCWGEGDHGELGDDSFDSTSSPVFVDMGGGVTVLVAGVSHTCALQEKGILPACWGAANDGQLGDNYGQPSDFPVPVDGWAQ